jgi:UDP-N-acetyl-D-mannosaminuronate dehydrogenase
VSDPQVQAVSVFGLGYVGCVSAACLASRGHRAVGVDVNPDKVESLQQGRSPVVEEKIGDLTAEVVDAIKRAAPDRLVLDLVRLPDAEELRANSNYRGIGW